MSIKQATPYLFFTGNATQAVRFYEKALGATVEGLQTVKDLPPGMEGCGPAMPADAVVNACLKIGDARVMLSDGPMPPSGTPASNVAVCIELDDPKELDARCDALAAGGKVTMPPGDAFWGARFAAVTDQFGISWMLNCMTSAR